jgi:hypothetical protein
LIMFLIGVAIAIVMCICRCRRNKSKVGEAGANHDTVVVSGPQEPVYGSPYQPQSTYLYGSPPPGYENMYVPPGPYGPPPGYGYDMAPGPAQGYGDNAPAHFLANNPYAPQSEPPSVDSQTPNMGTHSPFLPAANYANQWS